jgi:dihydrofolate reductase
MGRKTYESIGRPLPNRTNFIVSRTLNSVAGAKVFNNLEDSIKAAKEESAKNEQQAEAVIIGGGYLFRDTILTFNKLVLTRVDCDIEGDVFYPSIDFSKWHLTDSKSFKKDSDNDYDFKVEEFIKL